MARDKERGGSGKSAGQEDALAALQAHFAASFDAAPIRPVSTAVKAKGKSKAKQVDTSFDAEPKKKESDLDAALRRKGKAATKAPSALPSVGRGAPQTVVFDGDSSPSRAGGETGDGGGWRKFMSAKVDTQRDKEDVKTILKRHKKGSSEAAKQRGEDGAMDADDADEAEKQNVSNDRALSELLSTTLFAPGGEGGQGGAKRANGKANLSSNATLARLLELGQPTLTDRATSVGRGLGGSLLKANELGRMPATMRHGMRKAEQDRQARDVDKAKELGIYHQSIKHLLGKGADGTDRVLGTRDKDRKARTRQKGMSMGVGSFAGGTLRLSEQEVRRINGAGKGGKAGGSSSSKRKRD